MADLRVQFRAMELRQESRLHAQAMKAAGNSSHARAKSMSITITLPVTRLAHPGLDQKELQAGNCKKIAAPSAAAAAVAVCLVELRIVRKELYLLSRPCVFFDGVAEFQRIHVASIIGYPGCKNAKILQLLLLLTALSSRGL